MIMSYVAGLHVGAVETCSTTEIKIIIDIGAPQDMAFNTAEPQAFPRLNGYVLIPNEGGTVVALISRMSMEPAPAPSPANLDAVLTPVSRRRLFATPIGTLMYRRGPDIARALYCLRRGVSSFPAVGDTVVLPTSEQLRAIVEASGEDRRVTIGRSGLALDASVTVDPDKLFGRHVGVFGNTGSGKSCTVAGLVRWSIEAAAGSGNAVTARFVILDPNGEYRKCFDDLARYVDVHVFSVEPQGAERKLTVPAWMWNGQEWSGALEASAGTQRPVLMQAIRHLRAAALAGGPVPAALHRSLLSGHLRAYYDYFSAQRAQGVAVLGVFPKFKLIHSNMESMEAEMTGFRDGLGPAEDVFRAALSDLIAASKAIRKRRSTIHSGRANPDGLWDDDMAELLAALGKARSYVPNVAVIGGPSEDTPGRFNPFDLPDMIDLLSSLHPGNMQQHMAGLDVRLRTLLADRRIAPIIAPSEGDVPLREWLADLLGTGEGHRGQVSVLDLSLVPYDVMTTVVAVLARLIFETAQRHRRSSGLTMPIVLILEEAHNFVQRHGPDADQAGAAVRCRQVFEKISKEGRKFGVGLVLSSQRPAELAPTVVAMCNSFILHRIVNDRDQELVCKLAPDSTGSLLKELPSLPTQKAVLLGLAAEIPLVFEVRPLMVGERPHSAHPDFWNVWTQGRSVDVDFDELALRWSD